MNQSLRNFLGLAVVAASFVTGCGRTAPFDQMDQAAITVMRLTTPAPPPAVTTTPTTGGLPQIPGLPVPPELQAAGQQLLQGVNQAVPGLIPPALLPGQTTQTQQPVPQQEIWNGLAVIAKVPLANEDMKNDLLDLFGDEDSFQQGAGNCPSAPGMGISMTRPNQPNVDLLVSFTCKKAMGTGFQWPYSKDGLTPESEQKLGAIYQALFGMPVPAGS